MLEKGFLIASMDIQAVYISPKDPPAFPSSLPDYLRHNCFQPPNHLHYQLTSPQNYSFPNANQRTILADRILKSHSKPPDIFY